MSLISIPTKVDQVEGVALGTCPTLMKHLTLISPLFGWFHPHTIMMGCVLDALKGILASVAALRGSLTRHIAKSRMLLWRVAEFVKDGMSQRFLFFFILSSFFFSLSPHNNQFAMRQHQITVLQKKQNISQKPPHPTYIFFNAFYLSALLRVRESAGANR